MPRDKEIPGSPQEWITRAKSALLLAGTPLPEGLGFGEPVTLEEYREALNQAESVVVWAEKQIPKE